MGRTRRDFLSTTAATILGGATATTTTGDRQNNQTDTESAGHLLEPADSQQEWTHVNKNLQNTSRNPKTRVPDHNTETITETEEDDFDQDSVTVFDSDNIYIGDWWDGTVTASDRQTGEKQWEVNIGSGIGRPISVSDDFVYASAGGTGELAAIDKENGEKEHTAQLNSVGEATYVDGQVVVTESTGTARVFDEDLSNERVFDDHHTEVNIATETTVIDGDRIVYAERENGGTPHLMMLDFDAEVIDSEPIDGNANNGAVLHNGLFVYNEDEEMVAIEITEDGIGDEQWRTTTGDYGNNRLSPVAYKDWVFQGNNSGEIHAINTETGEKQLIDEFDYPIHELVAGEHTLVVGDSMRNSKAYDLDTGELVTEYEGFKNPAGVADDKLFMKFYNPENGKFGVQVWDGDYREIPPELDYELSGVQTNDNGFLAGSNLSIENFELEEGSGEIDQLYLEIRQDGETIIDQEIGDPEDKDLQQLINELEETSYEVEITAEDVEGVTNSKTQEFNLNKLDFELDKHNYTEENNTYELNTENIDFTELNQEADIEIKATHQDNEQKSENQDQIQIDQQQLEIEPGDTFTLQTEIQLENHTYTEEQEIDYALPEAPVIDNAELTWNQEQSGHTPHVETPITLQYDTENTDNIDQLQIQLLYSEEPDEEYEPVNTETLDELPEEWQLPNRDEWGDGHYKAIVTAVDENNQEDQDETSPIQNSPKIMIGEYPAKDTTGDGLLNDIDGDGDYNIFDVQSLFNNLYSDPVQNNTEYFNFSNTEEVGIFDVQALFEQLD